MSWKEDIMKAYYSGYLDGYGRAKRDAIQKISENVEAYGGDLTKSFVEYLNKLDHEVVEFDEQEEQDD